MAKRIRILATSDTHGYIYPCQYTDNSSVNQGLARMHTLISALRDENTLVIDNGDVLEGSPLDYYHFHYHRDEVSPVTKVMNAMGYDFANVGNHDFNYGKDVLYRHLENLDAPCITANVIDEGVPLGPTYVIKELAGKKIALFGLCTPYIPHWEPQEHIQGMKFLSAVKTAEKTVDLIRHLEKPDYIVCVYHGGFEKDPVTGIPTEEQTGENEGFALLEQVRGIDVLIAGHQHIAYLGSRNGTVYTQTKSRAAQLACIDIYTDTGVIEPRLLDADMDADEGIMELVQPEEDECRKWLDQPLGTTAMDLRVDDQDDARFHKHQIITFLNRVSREITGADLAASALFLDATGFRHDITMRDIVGTYVYPNTPVVKKINGRILREYLEKNAEYWTIRNDAITVARQYLEPKPKPFDYDMVDGIEYTIKVSNAPGSRIIDLTFNGQPVTDEMEFTLCITDYRASGGGDFPAIRKAPTVKRFPASYVELIADWILEHKTIEFEPVHNIHVIK